MRQTPAHSNHHLNSCLSPSPPHPSLVFTSSLSKASPLSAAQAMDDFHSLLLPPRVQRNARGLRADSVQSSSGYRDNATLHHGQVTLLPPPNMVRVRARASDSASLPPVLNSASSSRGVLGDVPEQQEPAGLTAAGAAESNIARPAARRMKRRPADGGGVSVSSSSRAGGSGGGAGLTAAAAYARDISREHARAARAEARAEERRRAASAAVRQQQERAAADLSSVRAEHPATERLRTQQARVGSGLGRGASMRRRNVQIGWSRWMLVSNTSPGS